METGYDTVVTKSQKKRHLYWKSETLLLVGAMYCETWAFYNHLFFLVTVDSEACEQQTHFPSSLLSKRRPEMRPLFAGYRFSRLLKFFRKIILLPYPVKTEIVVERKDFSDESSLLGNIMCYVFSSHQHYIETPYKVNQTFKWISKNKKKWSDSGHCQVTWCKSTQIELKRRIKKDDDTW